MGASKGGVYGNHGDDLFSSVRNSNTTTTTAARTLRDSRSFGASRNGRIMRVHTTDEEDDEAKNRSHTRDDSIRDPISLDLMAKDPMAKDEGKKKGHMNKSEIEASQNCPSLKGDNLGRDLCFEEEDEVEEEDRDAYNQEILMIEKELSRRGSKPLKSAGQEPVSPRHPKVASIRSMLLSSRTSLESKMDFAGRDSDDDDGDDNGERRRRNYYHNDYKNDDGKNGDEILVSRFSHSNHTAGMTDNIRSIRTRRSELYLSGAAVSVYDEVDEAEKMEEKMDNRHENEEGKRGARRRKVEVGPNQQQPVHCGCVIS